MHYFLFSVLYNPMIATSISITEIGGVSAEGISLARNVVAINRSELLFMYLCVTSIINSIIG